MARDLIRRLNRDGAVLASHFGLRYRAILPESPRVKRRYGVCYVDGTIKIRLFHARTGRPLRYSSLVDTLCHELAHLAHFHHGRRFWRLYERILARARELGIYRPAPRRGRSRSEPVRVEPVHTDPSRTPSPPEPVQLPLFPLDREDARRGYSEPSTSSS